MIHGTGITCCHASMPIAELYNRFCILYLPSRQQHKHQQRATSRLEYSVETSASYFPSSSWYQITFSSFRKHRYEQDLCEISAVTNLANVKKKRSCFRICNTCIATILHQLCFRHGYDCFRGRTCLSAGACLVSL